MNAGVILIPSTEMSLWSTVLMLGTVTAHIVHAHISDLAVVKCCPESEQLDSDLRKCEPLSNDTISDEVTLLKNITVENVLDENLKLWNTSQLSWLPPDLQLDLGMISMIHFAQRPNCSGRHTLRLANPRSERVELLSNGSLLLFSPTTRGKFETHLFASEDFCVDTYNDTSGVTRHAYLICPCHKVQCVSKCCAFGKAKFCDGDDCNCEDHDSEWAPFHPDLPPPTTDFPYEILADNDGVCPEGFDPWVANPWIYPVHFTRTYWTYPSGDLFRDLNVCGDAVVRRGEPPRHGVMRCYRSPPFPEIIELGLALHVPGSVLLALSFATIILVPRRRLSGFSHVHDQAMCCHVLCLFGSSLTWSFFVGAASTVCQHTPIIIYFSLVSASLWLNVICINMACGFWKPLGMQHSRLGGAKGMFVGYSLYAWGISAIMTAFTAAMWYASEVPWGLIRPTLHETRTCYREEDGGGKMATFAYYYGPMTALLVINTMLFSSTAIRVRQLRRNSTILTNKLSNGKEASLHNSRRVMVYIKLLLLMGVAEMAVDVASWASNSNEYLFAFVASCLDVARAAAIFALCCCKRRTAAALRGRLAAWRWRRWRRSAAGPPEGGDDANSLPRRDSSSLSATQVTLCEAVDRAA